MRGIKLLHSIFPISTIFDSGVTGTNPYSSEYQDYMDLIQESAGYSDEMLEKYPDDIIDMILSQTYLSWQPTEKK